MKGLDELKEFDELKDFIDELHAKLDYDDYLYLINLLYELNEQFKRNNCKDDLRDWLIDNWFTVWDNISFSILTYMQNNDFDKNDVIDRDNLCNFISDRVKDGILNVVDTYEVQ